MRLTNLFLIALFSLALLVPASFNGAGHTVIEKSVAMAAVNSPLIVEKTPATPKVDPDPLKDWENKLPANKPKQTNGEDGLLDNPLIVSAVLAGILLAIVLTFRHHQLQNRKRKAESEEPDDKDRY